MWTDGSNISGIRFHLASGSKSKIYGGISDPSPPPTKFRGSCTCSRLVGIHGSRSKGVLKRLGFTFASPFKDIWGSPHFCPLESSSSSTTTSSFVSNDDENLDAKSSAHQDPKCDTKTSDANERIFWANVIVGLAIAAVGILLGVRPRPR